VSVDDVLQDAFLSLLRMDPRGVKSWKAMAQRIAHRRAVDAVRTATKGRRVGAADDDEDTISLSSVEGLDPGTDLVGSAEATEDEYLRIEQVLVLRRVARSVLEPRALRVFLEVHFRGTPRKELAEEFDLTQARISQIYRESMQLVRDASRNDPAFSITHPDEGRMSNDQ
jgi:RNA polymerase sigma factor (sigma-70 family)